MKSIIERTFDTPFAIQNFIDGKFVDPVNQLNFENINPATGEKLCTVPDSDEQDVNQAILAAQRAFPVWQNKSNEERFRILYAIAQAGKCFHSTSQWTEETEWKSMASTLKGKTPIDWIQNAANDLANSIKKE